MKFKRVPKHIGIIPDGNRRWAINNNMEKKDGYTYGVDPGVSLCKQMIEQGVEEATFYGFTKDNNKRPKDQTIAYVKACIDAVNALTKEDCNILVVGNTEKDIFPEELLKYTKERVNHGKALLNVNFLINYDWNWDLNHINNSKENGKVMDKIASKDISKIDLIMRWGGRTRLSGFLPAQSVYSDFYIVDDYWPDYKEEHFLNAMKWYEKCDVTLGG